VGNLKDWALGVAAKASKINITERQNGDVMILDLKGNILTGASAATVRGVIRRLKALLIATGLDTVFAMYDDELTALNDYL
jgi:N-dimethylarginine dimethylaminohydrolase